MEAIRLFNKEDGLGSIESLISLSKFPLSQINGGGVPTYTGLMILEELYEELIRRKEILPIESLTKEEKTAYWNEALLMMGRNKRAVKLAKCLYLVNKIY